MRMADLVELATTVARVDGINPTAAPRLAINRRSHPSIARRLELRCLFTVVLQGEKRVHTAWKTYAFAGGSVLVTSARTPSVSRVVRATPQKPYLSVLLDLDPTIVASVVGARTALPVRGMTTLATVSDAILGLVGAMLDPTTALVAERELIARLADSEHGTTIRAIAMLASPDQLVQAALGEIAAHAEQRISIEGLASHLGTSVSTLHHRFKARTGTTPLNLHKRIRLERARELMRLFAWTAEQTAREVGYASPAQFNRDYRRQFGAPPRRDRSFESL